MLSLNINSNFLMALLRIENSEMFEMKIMGIYFLTSFTIEKTIMKSILIKIKAIGIAKTIVKKNNKKF